MTIRRFLAKEAKNFWLALESQPDHPLSCRCDICLYFCQPKKPRFSRRTFFVGWLVHRIKQDDLVKNKKARRVRFQNEWAWKIDGPAYDEAPFKERLKKILADVFDGTGDDDLPELSSDDSLANYIKRGTAPKFIDFKDGVASTRWGSWLKAQPDPWKACKKNRQAARLCQRIIDFIRSRPGQKATQRELERHFSNKRKLDLERAFRWSGFYPGLKRRKKGKSIIFSWKRPAASKIKKYNRKVGDEVRAGLASWSTISCRAPRRASSLRSFGTSAPKQVTLILV